MDYSLPSVGRDRMSGVSPSRLRSLEQQNLYSIHPHACLHQQPHSPVPKGNTEKMYLLEVLSLGPFLHETVGLNQWFKKARG